MLPYASHNRLCCSLFALISFPRPVGWHRSRVKSEMVAKGIKLGDEGIWGAQELGEPWAGSWGFIGCLVLL